jgi:16S rRNA (guanine527-N7)-methyltransferase
VELLDGTRALDLGTGGGLPGIPLSILLPNVHFVLVDSIQKKITAVKDMIDRLELPNVSVVCSRAEDLNTSPGYSKSFDAVIARAVSGLENIVSWASPFLRRKKSHTMLSFVPGGMLKVSEPAILAMKGGETQAEVAKTLRLFPTVHIHSMELVFNGGEIFANSGKRLIIIENE